MSSKYDNVIRKAILDHKENCRYSLTREWDTSKQRVLFVLMKPGKGDDVVDDTTVKRCIGFAKNLNYGSLEIVNLFAYITDSLEKAQKKEYQISHINNQYIIQAISKAHNIIVGWGEKANGLARKHEILNLLKDKELFCFGHTKNGEPRSPLRLSSDTPLTEYNGGR